MTTKSPCISEKIFKLSERNTTVRREVIAGLTTFLTMVYSVLVVPGMLSAAGFDPNSTFLATCLVAGLGSLIMALWANLPMAIGCAISLTAFTAFSLCLGQGVSPEVALAAVVLMGAVFTLISATGIRRWILANLPSSVAHGAGIGIGLFLLLIATSGVKIVVANTHSPIPVTFGDFTSLPVLASLAGLVLIVVLEKLKVIGGILITIIALTIFGLIFDPAVTTSAGFFKLPTFGEHSLFLVADFKGLTNPAISAAVFALVMTAVFDATGTIRAVAGQAGLVKKDGTIISGDRALEADSVSSIVAGLLGTAPAAVYIESASGTAAGGKTGLTALVVGVLFLAMIFFQPIALLVPAYATAPALMYVGLLMLSNVKELDFSDFVGAMSGLVTAVFILLSANIVTGIMLGFCTLVLGRVLSGEFKKLNLGTILIAIALFAFYISGQAI